MTDRAMAVPPSRALVFEVTAFAPSTSVTTPSTPTSRIIIATRTSMSVNPAWAVEREREAIQTATRPRARTSRGGHPPMAIGAMADPLPVVQGGPQNDEGRARRPAPLKQLLRSGYLPGTAVAAATAARGRAGLGDAGRRLRVREGVAGLRGTDDRVGRGALGRDDHRRQGQTAAGDIGLRGVTAHVGLSSGEAGLHVRNEVTHVGLGLGVLTLLTLTKERRQRDGGQDSDDQNDDEQLDEGKALLPVVNALAKLPQHVCLLLEVTGLVWCQLPRIAA